MALERLTCDTIGDLNDSGARIIINDALSECYRDLEQRGHDEKARTLDIKLTFLTKKGITVVDVQAKATMPPYRTNMTAATIHANKNSGIPELFFQEHNPENADQPTLDEFADKAEGEI